MGQYHHIVCLDKREQLDPHDLGCGLKAGEQSYTYGAVRAALVAFLSRRPGNMPADLGYAPKLVGRWAGKRVLAIGDYAEDGDLPGYDFDIPEGELYGACREKPVRPKRGYRYRIAGESETQAILRGKREHAEALAEWAEYCRTRAPLRNVSGKALGLLESACNVRYAPYNDGWRTFACVKALAELGDDGFPRYVLLDERDRDYLWRMAGSGEWWARAPLDKQHSGVRDGELDCGQRRVVANLDKREFFDPRALGEVPTTAALMRGEDGCSALALMLMLFHPERRGGGDVDRDEFPEVGRWRGDRLVITAEHEAPRSRFPDTARVEREFANISPLVLAATTHAMKEYA